MQPLSGHTFMVFEGDINRLLNDIIFYYLMLNQIFPGRFTKIFRKLHKLDENKYLNSSCRSQS